MTFNPRKPYYCGCCGRDGPGWKEVGIQDMGNDSRWWLANCPKCGSTRCVERVG